MMTPQKINLLAIAVLTLAFPVNAQDGDALVGSPLPGWRKGEMDIHHINTGRGEAQLMILPDGTSLLVDMSGKTVERPPFSLPTRPNASRAPGEWVARYVRRVLPQDADKIDYALISHFHGDHMGAIVESSPLAGNGAYRLSGITEIAEHLPIARVIDRAWPDYDYPEPIRDATIDNYRAFLAWQVQHNGLEIEQFRPGRDDQLVLTHDAQAYPQFQIRNLYANGILWTGVGDETRNLFPPVEDWPEHDRPEENKLSIAFRLSYGQFDYFTGGDLSSIDEETASAPPSWGDVEPLVGQAAGRVEAMKANHHGSWDSNGIPFLAALRPRVIVVGARAEGHPSVNTWRRMTSRRVWSGERDIFVTNVSPATAITTYGIETTARSTQGHVVIRVAEGGASFRVFVLEDSTEDMTVKAVFGPYASQ
jgi:beta-lactamase superfamily II metal-dependent hydrolase